jgi:hypothetical protein
MDNYSYEQKINILKNDIKKINGKLKYYFSNKFLKDPNEDNYILKQNFYIIETIMKDVESDFISIKDYIVNGGEKNIIEDKIESIVDNLQLVTYLNSKCKIQTESFYDKIQKIIDDDNKNIEHFNLWKKISKAAKKLADKIVKKVFKPIEKFFKDMFKNITKIFSSIGDFFIKLKEFAEKYILKVLNWFVILGKMFLYLIDQLIPSFYKFLSFLITNIKILFKQTWVVLPLVYTVLNRFFPKYIDYVIVDILRELGLTKTIRNKFNQQEVVEFFLSDDELKNYGKVLALFFTWILFWKSPKTLITIRDYLITICLYLLFKFIDVIKYLLLKLFKLPINHDFFQDLGDMADPKFLLRKFMQLLNLLYYNLEKVIVLTFLYFLMIMFLIKNVLPHFSKSIPTPKELYLYFQLILYKLYKLFKSK